MENGHTLSLENRERLTLTGVTDVDSFNEEEISAITPCGELSVKGEALHIEELNIENGLLTVSGKISSLCYSEKFNSVSVLKRLFGG